MSSQIQKAKEKPQLPATNGATNGAQATTAIQRAADATLEIGSGGEVVHVGFDTLDGFRALQRIGQAFASSSIVPEAFRGNIANCVIAIDLAIRMKASPMMVMQNLYIVHGTPGWSGKFLIAAFNQCGRFTAIKYRWVGEKGKASFGCQAWAKEKDTGEIVEGPAVTWVMVKAEKWDAKAGSKWLTMPDLMFMYRSAAFLQRTVAPEVTMGLQTAEEIEDTIGDVAPAPAPKQIPRGVQGLNELVSGIVPPAAAEPDVPHDATTGEVRESSDPDAEEKARILADEKAEAEKHRG